MNLPVVILAGIAAVALIVFMVIRNQKDKKDLVNKLNNDYRKLKDEENIVDTEGEASPVRDNRPMYLNELIS